MRLNEAEPGWLARNLTLPNAITVVRIGLIAVFGVLFVQGNSTWAIVALAVAGVSDFADGYLARRLGQTSELGAFLDPAADRILTVVVVLALAWREIIPWWLVAVLLARDLVMGVVLLLARRKGLTNPKVTFLGKAATMALYVFLPLAYLAFDRWPAVHLIAIVGAALSGIAYWGSAAQYVVQLRTQGRAARVTSA